MIDGDRKGECVRGRIGCDNRAFCKIRFQFNSVLDRYVAAAAKAGCVLFARIDRIFITARARQSDVRHRKEDQKRRESEMKVPHSHVNIEYLLCGVNRP